MKIKPEHYEHMRAAIAPSDTARLRDEYRALALSSKRYRWDLTYAAKLSPWICDNLYAYLDDTHIDTALRRIVADL